MKPASGEQISAVELLGRCNVVADCVAGSGKTTTVLHVAMANKEAKILLLTYNARLKMETRARAEAAGVNNLFIDTYHSFGVRYVSYKCCTDNGLIKYVDGEEDVEFPAFDIIIIDECQDMTPLYYRFVQKFIGDARLMLLGDRHQNIYTYAGSDARFMTLAGRIYGGEWGTAALTTSYRITHQIAAFTNFLLGVRRIQAARDGPRPRYTISQRIGEDAAEEVMELLTKYTPDDIFILAPTVKSLAGKGTNARGNPIVTLANTLTGRGVPLYVPTSDDKKLSEDVLRGKVTFSSFHQSKGLERECVIVLGFDQSYFDYYAKGMPQDHLPNTLYVAMTRARTHLSVYHSQSRPFFSYVSRDGLGGVADVRGKIDAVSSGHLPPKATIDVTEMSRHLPSIVLHRAMNLIPHRVIIPPGPSLRIPTTTAQGDLTEDVADINGVAVTLAFEREISGHCHAVSDLYTKATTAKQQISAEMWLQIATEDISNRDKLLFRKSQIQCYDWMTDEHLAAATERLKMQVGAMGTFETPVGRRRGDKEIRGRTDISTPDTVYEIKVTSSLQPEHYIQLALYAWCVRGGRRFLLFNVNSGELAEVVYDENLLTQLVDLILCRKFHIPAEISDEQFLQNLGATVDELVDAPCSICDVY